MDEQLPPRQKWQHFLDGEDVGPMVSPLCDDWSLDVPYSWPYDEPDPFPPGERWHAVSQQMAMAQVCGWDPTFLCAVDMGCKREDLQPTQTTEKVEGVTRTESRTPTPYGDLTSISEHKTTSRTIKAPIEAEEDFHKMAWLVRQQMDYDEDTAISEGEQVRAAIGDRGVMGTWFGSPAMGRLNTHDMFYHLADWPDAFEELHQANRELALKQIETLHKAGFDYLFYCVNGTEWISPGFFRDFLLEDTREIFRRWRDMGGFILWHSCGRLARFVEEGFYNELKPEVLETLSEPPVGDLPSLKWARDQLDPGIATKGNVPLEALLLGTVDEVRAQVQRVRSETEGYRHIVGLSDDILKKTPLANAKAFVDGARK